MVFEQEQEPMVLTSKRYTIKTKNQINKEARLI